jgi:hypothetical protein
MERLKQSMLLSFHNQILVAIFLGSLLYHPACGLKPATADAQGPVAPRQTHPHQVFAQPQAEDGQWTMPAKNYASTRYSPDQHRKCKESESSLDLLDRGESRARSRSASGE